MIRRANAATSTFSTGPGQLFPTRVRPGRPISRIITANDRPGAYDQSLLRILRGVQASPITLYG
jgi:hypothetical protein